MANKTGAPPVRNPARLYVSNLKWEIADADLSALFQPFGDVIEARIVTDARKGGSRGYGFVTYSAAAAAQVAATKMNGKELQGRTIGVEFSQSIGPLSDEAKLEKKRARLETKKTRRAERKKAAALATSVQLGASPPPRPSPEDIAEKLRLTTENIELKKVNYALRQGVKKLRAAAIARDLENAEH
jgi:RNA recognition motif-containing protein